MSRFRRVDSGYIVVLIICFLAVWPFLKHASLPHDTDAELHIFRLAELQRMWAGGAMYPRWAANFYYGYGYPIFNYYAPLTYYLGLLWLLIPGITPVTAIKAVFILALTGAGLSMYSFVRDSWGRNAGFVAAASYVYAPYILYIDSHARGVLPETFSFAVFPIALTMLNRLRRRPCAHHIVFASLAIAAVILTHNLMAMVFGGLLFAWFLWELARIGVEANLAKKADKSREFEQHSKERRQFLRDGGFAFAIGVALSAFFWLPMAGEQGAIQIGTVVGEGSHYDFRNHFLTLRELLSASQRIDWGATEAAYSLNLGVMQWVLGALGFVALFLPRTDATTRRRGLFFALLAVILIALILPISLPIWRAIPLLPFLQFPWRLIGATNAMLAVLAGIGTATVATQLDQRVARFVPTVAVLAIILVALPLTQVNPWGQFGTTTAQDVLTSELLGRWRGTTSTADFVPVTVEQEPREEGQMIERFMQNLPIDHLNRAVLGDAQVETEVITPLHLRYVIDTPHEFVLRLYIFDFPGWRATLNGESAEIVRATPEGFITVTIPVGQHVLDVAFGTTRPRQLGWLVSGIGLLMLLVVANVLHAKRPPLTASGLRPAHQDPTIQSMLIGLFALIVIHLAVIEPQEWLHYNSADRIVEPAQTQLFANYSDDLALLGFTAPESVAPGEKFRLDLYWKALHELDDNWQVFVHVLSEDTRVLTQSDKLNPGDFPTEQWPLDKYIRDPHWITIPNDLPPGDYQLTAGLWSIETGERLPVLDPAGEWFVLQKLTVKK